ncbi:MAG: hypothetical protein SPL61_09240 [Saccharofermentans sp.]|nr:hypothetical protein [Saccharofermentans sp.]
MKKIKSLVVILASGMFMTFAVGCSSSSSNNNSFSASSAVQEIFEPAVASTNQDKVIDSSSEEGKSQPVLEQLVAYGYSYEQAETIQKLLAECGINDISTFEILDETNVEGLVTLIDKSRKDITIWFVIDNGELYYVGYNGKDLYTQEEGVVANITDFGVK